MKTRRKALILLAIMFIIIGLIIFFISMKINNWEFGTMSTEPYETNTYENETAPQNIIIRTDTADISFCKSAGENCKVVCFESAKAKHTVTFEGDTLSIKVHNTRKWYDYIAISFNSPEITVYLPEKAYNSLSIEDSTGKITIPDGFTFNDADISSTTGRVDFDADVSGTLKITTTTGAVDIEEASFGKVKINVSTGNVEVSDIKCEGKFSVDVTTGSLDIEDLECDSFSSTGSTGNIRMEKVIAQKTIEVERSTGYVKFEDCDAQDLTFRTSTGSVKGTLLSDKIFFTDTSTGNVSVPHTTSGGKCEITTSTGNINVEIAK